MKKKNIEKYVVRQIKKLDKHLLNTKSTKNIKSIHKFRVCIKKLNAVFRFVSKLNKCFEGKKKVKSVFNIYKALGKVRDIQIQERNLMHYAEQQNTSFPEFENYLDEQKQQAIDNFGAIIKKQKPVKTKKLLKHLRKALQKVPNKKIEKKLPFYAKQSIDYVVQLLKEGACEETIHHIRRVLKDLMYLIQFSKFGQSFSIDNSSLNVKTLKRLGFLLGTWHDMIVMRDTLHNLNIKHDYFLLETSTKYKQLLDNIENDIHLHLNMFIDEFSKNV